MCCILYIPNEVNAPSEKTLDVIYKNNHDGIGIVDASGYFTHTFSYDILLSYLKARSGESVSSEIQNISKNVACIIHFRNATRGAVSISNCQPFYDPGCGIYFAHNGTFHNVPEDDTKSDSYIFFNDIFVPAARASNWDDELLWDAVKTKIERSRVIFMNNKGEVKMFAGDPSFRDWICRDGIYYSRSYPELGF